MALDYSMDTIKPLDDMQICYLGVLQENYELKKLLRAYEGSDTFHEIHTRNLSQKNDKLLELCVKMLNELSSTISDLEFVLKTKKEKK